MMRALEVRITGEVQGVSFRAYAAREAVRLELTGWVRNEPDGAVRARFQGPDDKVEEMVAWCRTGSPAAHVDDVALTEAVPDDSDRFEVEY